MGTGLPERARSAGASQGLGCTEASLSGWDCVWVWTAEPLASSLPGAEPESPGAEPGTLGYRDTLAISAAPGPGLSRETGTVPSVPVAPSRGAPPAQGHGCPTQALSLFFSSSFIWSVPIPR